MHFTAIGGTGMGAAATLLRAMGHDVRGSDGPLYPPMSVQIERAQIPVFEGFRAENLDWDPEVVVIGNVCTRDHVEVIAAQERGMRLTSFPAFLEETLLQERRSLVVAGTHGKTTTASLLAWILQACGKDPSWLVGGVPVNLWDGSHLGAGPAMVIEGDEYDTAFFDKKSKFLHYRPYRAALTNLEFDHADIFVSIREVRQAFRAFVELIEKEGELVVHRDDPEVMGIAAHARCQVTTYRVLPSTDEDVSGADYTARVLGRVNGRRSEFEVFERGESLGLFSSMLLGRYNIANILAAIALARQEGCSPEQLRSAIARFRGVKRRQELLGVGQGVRVIDDFAHHPTAVRVTVAAIRRRYPDQALHVCFDPRSASSRRNVFAAEYTTAFSGASHVYFGPVHAKQKLPEHERLDTEQLAQSLREGGLPARSYESIDGLLQDILEQAVPGDTVLLLSSGQFGNLAKRILQGFGDAVEPATPTDIPQINSLLSEYSMPSIARPQVVESLVIRDQEKIVGCVNLEIDDDTAFLFGLAVRPDRRGEGLGWALADCVLRRAQTLGARLVYLLTGDTADFFAMKLGFTVVPVEELDLSVRQFANFSAIVQEGIVCMKCVLPSEGA